MWLGYATMREFIKALGIYLFRKSVNSTTVEEWKHCSHWKESQRKIVSERTSSASFTAIGCDTCPIREGTSVQLHGWVSLDLVQHIWKLALLKVKFLNYVKTDSYEKVAVKPGKEKMLENMAKIHVWISLHLVLLLQTSSRFQDWCSTWDVVWKAVGKNWYEEALAAWILWCSWSELAQWVPTTVLSAEARRVEATAAAGMLHQMTDFCSDSFQIGCSTSKMYVRAEYIATLLWSLFVLVSCPGFWWGADEQISCLRPLKMNCL